MERSERGFRGAAADGKDRFDSDSVRQILERAAIEQHRLNSELTDTYSVAELEEMAAEARISPEALRAAIETHSYAREPRRAANRPGERARNPLAALPLRWSPAVKQSVLASAGALALFGVLLTFPVLAQVFLLTAIIVSVLLLLGASPF